MILINGIEQATIAVSDRGLHYGDGLFETMAVLDGRPRLWRAHIQRLAGGCQRLGIPLPDEQTLMDEIAQTAQGEARAVVKLIVTRGSGGRGYRLPESVQPTRIVMGHPWPAHADSDQPIRLRLCQTPLGCNPALAGIKHLNRLEQVLARSEWSDEGYDEGLMCNLQGDIIEGTMSNLFTVRGGELLTPALADCGVEGVMRRTVLQVADALGLTVRQTRFSADAMAEMEEVFITNAILGMRPVCQFETVHYGDNPLTQRLQRALQEKLTNDDT